MRQNALFMFVFIRLWHHSTRIQFALVDVDFLCVWYEANISIISGWVCFACNAYIAFTKVRNKISTKRWIHAKNMRTLAICYSNECTPIHLLFTLYIRNQSNLDCTKRVFFYWCLKWYVLCKRKDRINKKNSDLCVFLNKMLVLLCNLIVGIKNKFWIFLTNMKLYNFIDFSLKYSFWIFFNTTTKQN